MPDRKPLSNFERSEDYGLLQQLVDALYADSECVRRLDAVTAAKASDLPEDLVEIVESLPPGDYYRADLCEQLNSAINGHAWGQVYGTVN